jgi:hypothetical protein
MGILSALLGRKTRESTVLVGCWHLVRVEGQPYEPAEADFREDGTLYYSVLAGTRWQIMKLRYRVDGDTIISDQPSAPREERTRFALGLDGALTLEFGDTRGLFRRGEKQAPLV